VSASEHKGMIQVYTGDGKGKTTASLGLALRAVGHGRKVIMLQFLKAQDTGERVSAQQLAPLLTIIPMGRAGFINPAKPEPEDKRMAKKALDYAKELIRLKACDILILDEVNIAVAFGLIAVEDLLAVMDSRPEEMELVLTGRNAHPKVMEKADLVTEMKNIKHYYDQGVPERISTER